MNILHRHHKHEAQISPVSITMNNSYSPSQRTDEGPQDGNEDSTPLHDTSLKSSKSPKRTLFNLPNGLLIDILTREHTQTTTKRSHAVGIRLSTSAFIGYGRAPLAPCNAPFEYMGTCTHLPQVSSTRLKSTKPGITQPSLAYGIWLT